MCTIGEREAEENRENSDGEYERGWGIGAWVMLREQRPRRELAEA